MSEQQDILLINRDSDFSEAMAGFIRKAGISVHIAMDMRGALEALCEKPIGLIMCDNVLQDISGYDFLRFIKSDPLRELIPFVFLVPINDQGHASKAFELGASDFLVYPLEVEDLTKRIEEIMASGRGGQAESARKEGGGFRALKPMGAVSPDTEVEKRESQEAVSAAEPPQGNVSAGGATPPTKDVNVSNDAPTMPHVRVDVSRDGLFWVPGQIKDFTEEGVLVVTALLGKPGVGLSVRFPLENDQLTITGNIKRVVFGSFEKPVGIDVTFERNDEWSQALHYLQAVMSIKAEKGADGAETGSGHQETVVNAAGFTGTVFLPHESEGLHKTLLLSTDQHPETKSLDLRFYHSLIGKQLDNYRAVSFIGAGTMGGVFKGWDAALERVVALKVISYDLSSQEGFRDMFIKEARLISRLDHSNIAHIYTIGNTNDILYFAMEFIDGETMADLIEKHGNLYTLRGLDYLIIVCETLDFVWHKSIIHRDIKPENILINSEGTLKIVDFGVAKKLDVNASGDSQEGIVGSPLYVSPDSITRNTVDYRSDIYSLGATFYHAFTGVPPFEGEDTKKVLLKHMHGRLASLPEQNPKISMSLSKIIERMMAKDPDDRYQDYQGIINDLKEFRSRVIQAKRQRSGRVSPAGTKKTNSMNGEQ
jgi:CheY-like chemotaxis protein/predicted Ser/Thr protein kinase